MTEQEVLELLKGTFDLTIPNFRKWNPDTRHHRAWVALSVDFFRDPKISQLSDSERCMFISLLLIGARSGGVLAEIGSSFCRDQYKIRGSSVVVRMLKLWKLGLIILRCHSLQTDRQTDRHSSAESSAPKVRKTRTRALLRKPFVPTEEGMLSQLPENTVGRLKALYPETSFLQTELSKMLIWLAANSHKTPKSVAGWSRFVSGWLARGWEQHRKTITSTQLKIIRRPKEI